MKIYVLIEKEKEHVEMVKRHASTCAEYTLVTALAATLAVLKPNKKASFGN